MALAAESLGNGIKHQGSQEVRPQRTESKKGKYGDEQVDHAVFRVQFEHLKVKDSGLL